MVKFGYTLFYVDDVAQSMNFYERAFGLTKGLLTDGHEYGEMITGETKLGFVNHKTAGSHGFTYLKSAQAPAAMEIGFVTTDVQQAYDRALKAGATSMSLPKEKPWGQMVAYVCDCNGFLVEICSPME